MNCAFPIPGPIAALASSELGRARGAELSIVSILDGEIGDPVTWVDEPDGVGGAGGASARGAAPFRAVADDIGAHLPTGTVLVHRPDSTLALLRRIFPGWRPAVVLNTLPLTEHATMAADRRQDTFSLAARPNAETGLGATAERAVATARLLLCLIDKLESGRFNSGLDQEEYANHFL